MSPCRAFELRSRLVKNVRLPKEGVMVPTRPAEERFSVNTLCLCLRLQITPGHWQKSSVVFHKASIFDDL
uniref:Uncharacterized protein n=1 Tax=Arundo donax TaxID=35708 RepID=A0A0A8YYZ9_ARUDO